MKRNGFVAPILALTLVVIAYVEAHSAGGPRSITGGHGKADR